MSQMLYNPYDLIIIKENVIPQENLDEIMLLTNNTKDITNATIINNRVSIIFILIYNHLRIPFFYSDHENNTLWTPLYSLFCVWKI